MGTSRYWAQQSQGGPYGGLSCCLGTVTQRRTCGRLCTFLVGCMNLCDVPVPHHPDIRPAGPVTGQHRSLLLLAEAKTLNAFWLTVHAHFPSPEQPGQVRVMARRIVISPQFRHLAGFAV